MWNGLPIVIKRKINQREGHGLKSSIKFTHGFDIKNIRDFEVGDSPRLVNRSHLAKFGEPIIIEKYPDRNAVVAMLVDVSRSEKLGSEQTKLEAKIDLLRWFSSACISKGHRVIIVTFTDRIEFESPLIKSCNLLEEAVRESIERIPVGKLTDPGDAINYAHELATRQNYPVDLVCVLSDFLFPREYTEELGSLYDASDVIVFIVRDKIELQIPPIAGGMTMRDSETGEIFCVASMEQGILPAYLKRIGIDICLFNTKDSEEECFDNLQDFFTLRMEEK